MLKHNNEMQIELAYDIDEGCPYCGQVMDRNLCKPCVKEMEGVVLAICRQLLMHEGRAKIQKRDEKTKDAEGAVKELEIVDVLDRFPYELAKRTSQFPKSLNTDGVWFSHVVAYQFVLSLRNAHDLAPAMVAGETMYQTVRKQVYDFLAEGESGFSDETRDFIDNVYSLKNEDLDTKKIILAMAYRLEEMGLLKIVRPKTNCVSCGKEMTDGKQLCEECEKEQTMDMRLSISAKLGKPIIGKETKEETSSPIGRGMHFKK